MKRKMVFEKMVKRLQGDCEILKHSQNWAWADVESHGDPEDCSIKRYTIDEAIAIVDEWEKEIEKVVGIINMSPRKGDAPMVTEYGKDCVGCTIEGDIEREYPIPYDTIINLSGKWEFRFYVESTAGGGASWETMGPGINDTRKEYVMRNYGKLGCYSTLLAGYIVNPEIMWARNGCAVSAPAEIKQSYLRGFNFFTRHKILGGDTFLQKESRKMLIDLIDDCELLDFGSYTQGHLACAELTEADLSSTKVHVEDLERFPGKYHAKFFNHQCLGGMYVDSTRIDDTGYCLVHFRMPGWIVSPDHIDEAVSVLPGYYLLRHPIPHGDVD